MKTDKTEQWFTSAKDSTNNVFMGIDPSLTSTGIAVLRDDGKDCHTRVLSTKLTGLARLDSLDRQLQTLLVHYRPTAVALEGYSYGSPTNREALAEWGGLIRLALFRFDIPTLIVAPPTLRKFILPEALKGKEQTILATYKRWGLEFKTNDECDAHGLARLAALRHGLESGTAHAIDAGHGKGITGRMIEAAKTAAPAIKGPDSGPTRRRSR